MTDPPADPTVTEPLRLDDETVDALARRLAELLAPAPTAEESGPPRRLLSAAEVSRWWGVERSWVYAHADQLGAHRLGTGPRPRLRFDPDEVARRLAPHRDVSPIPTSARRRPCAERGALLPIRGAAELSSPHPSTDRPGDAPTPPAMAPGTRPSAR